MAEPVSIQPKYTPVEVDLWGEVYETRRQTKADERESDKLTDKFEEASVKLMGALLDITLKSTAEEQGKPSVHLLAKFRAGEVSLEEIQDFTTRLAEAERPTSPGESEPTSTS